MRKKREVKVDQSVPLGLWLNFPILRILHQGCNKRDKTPAHFTCSPHQQTS